MFHALSIGASALRANQIALDVTGHNIANANTAGYSRQTVHFAERGPTQRYGFQLGSGVDVSHIERAYSGAIGSALNENVADVASVEAQLQTVDRVETLLAPGVGSINSRMQLFFDSLERLSSHPGDDVARLQAVNNASRLTTELNGLANSLGDVNADLAHDLTTSIERVNRLSNEIVGLNRQIRQAKQSASNANQISDRRDQLVKELSGLVGARVDVANDLVEIGDGALVFGYGDPPQLSVNFNADGAFISHSGGATPLSIQSGSIGGRLAAYNEIVPRYSGLIDGLAGSLAAALDPIHSTGAGIGGPLTLLTSTRPVSDTSAPLEESAALPISAGELQVGLIDLSTGERTRHTISVDPAVDSLDSLAAKLSAIPNLSAQVNSQSGLLTLHGAKGFGFDFTGQLPTAVDTSGLSGSSQPRIEGTFDGPQNTALQFEFRGSGEIGLTGGLQLEVTDGAGAVLGVFEIGATYSPGDSISLPNGLTVSLGAGSVVDGESFATLGVADSDTSDVLASLGLNTFFSGTTAADIAVDPQIVQDTTRLATSRTGISGDGENLLRMLEARDARVASGGRRTVEQFAADIVAAVGEESNGLASTLEHLGDIGQQLAEQSNSLGVDPNEELVKMVQYQRSFQAAARYISAVDQTLDELFRIL